MIIDYFKEITAYFMPNNLKDFNINDIVNNEIKSTLEIVQCVRYIDECLDNYIYFMSILLTEKFSSNLKQDQCYKLGRIYLV